jgi:hypothetical protein
MVNHQYPTQNCNLVDAVRGAFLFDVLVMLVEFESLKCLDMPACDNLFLVVWLCAVDVPETGLGRSCHFFSNALAD